MSRPEIQGWIIHHEDYDPLQQPFYTFTSSGGYDNIPFFHNHRAAIEQHAWLQKMHPGQKWVILEVMLTTEKET
jgi:hypothetical protein